MKRFKEGGDEVPDLNKIFKAYDVRGVVPDELDESVAEAVGAAFVRLTGAKSIVTLHDMRTEQRTARRGARPRRRVPGRGRHPRRARLHRHGVLRERVPRHPRRDDHREPQPGQVQRDQALQGRREAGRHRDRPGRDQADGRGRRSGVRRPAGHGDEQGPAARLRRVPQEAGRHLRDPPAHGRRRRGQRHGRLHGADRVRGPADHHDPALLRARRHVPQPRGEPDRPEEPA